MNETKQTQRFLATIYKIGINRCVDVPAEISRSFAGKRYVPVVAVVNGRSVRTTLVPGRARCYRLYLNSPLRKAAHTDAGDLVGVLLRLDRKSRELPTPGELREALKQDPRARKAFRETTPALRREFLRWVLNAKHQETRLRRIQRGLKTLIARAAARRQDRPR
ncbi:MAG: YdeI/OmpD-associated family protein [Candidatus Acidiferrales bacterium]